VYAVDLPTIEAAAARVQPHLHRTPVITCGQLDAIAGRSLFLKPENLQKTGSFKPRGGLNAVASLPDAAARSGVVTHSSGNFAQAVAWAAKRRGIPAHIVMPSNAPAPKVAAVRGYGARVILCEPTQAARESTAEAVRQETGATFLHPYDQAEVIAGQGTIALELLEDVADLDAIVAPVGGGGMIAGIAIAAKAKNPAIRIYAAEPHGADDAWRSKDTGVRHPQPDPQTCADGLRTGIGALTFPVLRDLVDGVIRVAEAGGRTVGGDAPGGRADRRVRGPRRSGPRRPGAVGRQRRPGPAALDVTARPRAIEPGRGLGDHC
jgi:threonine dehydratase